MNPFVGSLVNSAAKGLTAYDDQQEINERKLLLEKIRQEGVKRQQDAVTLAQQNRDQDRQDRLTREEADRADREQRDNQQGLEHGIVPRSTNLVVEPNIGGNQAPAPAPFAPERLAVGADNPTPALLKRPVMPSIPHVRVDDTPAHYDQDADPAYGRTMDAAALRLKAQQEMSTARNARMIQGAQIMAKSRTDVANIAARSRTTASGGKGTMTGNGLENHFQRVTAPGLLQAHDGNLDEAIEDLTTSTEGKKLQAQGFTVEHLRAEYNKQKTGETSAALRLQAGGYVSPGKSVNDVTKTKQLVRGAQPPARQQGGAKPAPVEDIGPVSDAELTAAITVGGISPDDGTALRAYIKKQRASAKKP